MKHNHIYYDKIEKAIRPYLEKYGEPWERREPYNIVDRGKSIKQREQLAGYAVDHGVDTIGDERD